jgi:site-specific DNA-methyltransferase (adenine-specific)
MIKRDALYSSRSEEWETPKELFDELNLQFHFTLDPCSTDENAKCKKHYTK